MQLGDKVISRFGLPERWVDVDKDRLSDDVEELHTHKHLYGEGV